MRILVTGGAGYVGCRLVPALLADGHDVVVYDTFWFGDHLPRAGHEGLGGHLRLDKRKSDVRNLDAFRGALNSPRFECGRYGVDVVIHLACISNDPSFELDESLSRTINYEAFEPLVIAAKEAGVRRFIYCSSSSVYGVSDAPDVTEDHPLHPITLYNTYKGKCEPLLFKHASPDFECVVLRPSTVCGYSPRQRLDLAVNILTSQAFNLGKITVFGGEQRRPNIHIEDMVDCYRALLEAPVDRVQGQIFNVGAGNISIAQLARIVATEVEALTALTEVPIETKPIQDPRSYQVNSDKIARVLGFQPKWTVCKAVRDLVHAFQQGLIPEPMDRDEYYNVRQMRKVFPELYKGAPERSFRPEDGHLSEIDVTHRGAGK